MSVVGNLSRNSAIYVTAMVISGGINFGLLAVFTRLLTPGDFGVLAVIAATLGILGAVAGFNPTAFFTAKFPALEKHELREYIGASLLIRSCPESRVFG